VTKSDLLGDVAQLGAAAYVQGYSRDQEYEADQLGIRYMTKAGFEPAAMSTFLSSLEGEDQLARKKAGREGVEPEIGLFASHPRTADRIAIAAKTAAANAGGPIGRDRALYLKKIDGMIFGDSPTQGFVYGRNFAHPQLKFTFDAPPGFRLDNTQAAVIGRTKGDRAIMRFDGVRARRAGSLIDFITREWAPKANLTDLEEFTVNGLDAATGTTILNTQDGRREIRLVAIRFDGNQLYRFAFIGAPEIGRTLDEQFRETVFSFRRLTEREAAQLKPRRIKVVTVAQGDTPERMAQRMSVDEFPLETFLTLNGLRPGARLTPGSQVKLVVGGRAG
jgi:predicted Zn-dependent protease